MKVKLFLLLFLMGGVLNAWAQNTDDSNSSITAPKPISPEMQAYINHLMGLDKPQVPQSSKTGIRKASASAWSYPSSTPSTPYGGGSGTEANPYLISTPQHLANLAYMVNNGNSYSGQYFKMTDDLVLNAGVLAADGSLNSGTFKQWTPIGNSSNAFKGTFDGDNHYVSGLYISASSNDYKGLFGRLTNGTISHLGVVDSYIYGHDYIGAITGHADYGTSIIYCYSKTTIIGRLDVGGIVGDVCGGGGSTGSGNNVITACANYGKVTATSTCVGGITGYANSSTTISYCANYGDIRGGTQYTGGIMGQSSVSGTALSGCINTGTVSASSGSVGAICGGTDGNISNCYYEEGTCPGGLSQGTSASAADFANGTVTGLVDPSGNYFQQGADGKPVLPGVGDSSTGNLEAYRLTYRHEFTPARTESFASWTSTNHGDNTTSEYTYTFNVPVGGYISFNWSVSSESDYDKFSASLDGSTIISGKSGVDSGSYQSSAYSTAGEHRLRVWYSKDGSQSNGSDQAVVSNVKMYVPEHEEIDSETFSCPVRTGEDFEDWTSTNKTNESTSMNTIEFVASAGDILSFDWETSSELDADFLNVRLDGTLIVSEQSGNGTTGTFNSALTAGSHTLYMEYVKDEAKSRYNDEVYVRNIHLQYATPKTSMPEMTLEDGGNFIKIEMLREFSVDNFTYKRNFTNTRWQALYVPFSMPYEAWAGTLEVAALNDIHQYDRDEDGVIDDTELEVIKVKSGSLEPNVPYVIRSLSTGEKTISLHNVTLEPTEDNSFDVSSWYYLYTFSGTYSMVNDMYTQGHLGFSNGSLVTAASDAETLKAMRWYLDIESRDAKQPKTPVMVRIHVWGEDSDEETEGIGVINASSTHHSSTTSTFDLQGRQQMNAGKGLYIVNGKKIMK